MTEPGGPYDFVYVHTDIPPGMTIRAWRAERAACAAKVRDAQRRARRERAPVMFTKTLRRPGQLALRAIGRALPGRPLAREAIEARGYPRIY